MTSFRAPARSPFTVSLIAAAQAETLSTPRVRQFKALGERISDLMHTICQPYETFNAAVDAAGSVVSSYRAVMTAIGVADPFAAHDSGLERALAFDGRLLAGVLKQDGNLRQAMAAPDFFTTLDPIAPFGEIWSLVRQRYRHRALDEIDYAVPRFGADEHAFVRLLLTMSETPAPPTPRRRRWRRRYPSETDRQEGLEGYFRHSAAFCLAHVRHELLFLADRAVLAGKLTDRTAIWLLEASQVRALDQA